MTTIRAQVSLVNQSGLPVDIVTNTFHFISNSVDRLTDSSLIGAELDTFYTGLGNIFSTAITGAYTVDYYDLADPTPRVPFDTSGGTLATGTGATLPNEVAIVLSFFGSPISGLPPARARGRIFLGPLDGSVLDDAANDGRVQAATMTEIAAAAGALMVAGDPANFQWAVFSPTSAGAPPWTAGDLIGATRSIDGGWVDNAFDTMRSRGTAASARETFP